MARIAELEQPYTYTYRPCWTQRWFFVSTWTVCSQVSGWTRRRRERECGAHELSRIRMNGKIYARGDVRTHTGASARVILLTESETDMISEQHLNT